MARDIETIYGEMLAAFAQERGEAPDGTSEAVQPDPAAGRVCPNCGMPYEGGQRFCAQCGTPLEGGRP